MRFKILIVNNLKIKSGILIQDLIKQENRALTKIINLTLRYIEDFLLLNNSHFSDHLYRIYPSELKIKDIIYSRNSALNLDLHLESDRQDKLCTHIYDKRDDFDFQIVNIPYLYSNILSSPAYGMYISLLIRYSQANSHYHDFLQCCVVLKEKLLNQGYARSRLEKTVKKFDVQKHDLVKR